MSRHRTKKLLRARMWRANPHCYWCGVETVLIEGHHGQQKPSNMATIDHLYSRLHPLRHTQPRRGGGGERRLVLACDECNQRRARAEEQRLSMDEKHRRSGRAPMSHPDQRSAYELSRANGAGFPGLRAMGGSHGS